MMTLLNYTDTYWCGCSFTQKQKFVNIHTTVKAHPIHRHICQHCLLVMQIKVSNEIIISHVGDTCGKLFLNVWTMFILVKYLCFECFTFTLNVADLFFFSFQVTFPTRPFLQQAHWHGFRVSSAMSTIPVFITPLKEKHPDEWATSTTPCEKLFCTVSQTVYRDFSFLWLWPLMEVYSVIFSLSRLLVDIRTVLTISGNRTALSGLQDLSQAIQRLGERPDAWPSTARWSNVSL